MLGAMRLRPAFVAIVTCVGLAGCGGSSRSSSTQATATPAASSQTTSTTSTQSAATSSAAETITTTTNASAPPEVPKTNTHKRHDDSGGHGGASQGGSGASQGAHVESNLAVAANGDVSPPVVSVPSGVGLELHVANHGSSAATVVLSVPSHPSAHLAPGATGRLETGGLKNGTYRILVNGTPRGQLMIGAQGGP